MMTKYDVVGEVAVVIVASISSFIFLSLRAERGWQLKSVESGGK